MNDLHLWQLLQQEEVRAEEIVPLLKELAEWPLAERFPFFGVLPRALEHADPDVRSAAAGVLRGASGVLAFRQLVRALHDPKPSVRLAAVAALGESVADDPPRWAHALFHPDAEVRRWAVTAADLFPATSWCPIYLLPDPACAEQVLVKLAGRSLPSRVLPLIADYLERGLLSRPLARRFVAGMSWPDCFAWLNRSQSREAAHMALLLEAAGTAEGAATLATDSSRDGLDGFFDLFWDADVEAEIDPDSDRSPASVFFDKVSLGLLGQEGTRERVVLSLLITGARRGFWPQPAAEVCAVYNPKFLTFPWVDRAVRHAAVRGFYALGERCPRQSDEYVRQCLEGDLCCRSPGSLDLWVIGGLLHLVEKEPYARLRDWIGVAPIVSAFQQDMRYSAPFLCLRDDSAHGREYLIGEIAKKCSSRRTYLTALLVHVLSADRLGFLDGLDHGQAVKVFRDLLVLAERPKMVLSENKNRLVAQSLGVKIASGALDQFFRIWLYRKAPEEFDLGLAVFGVVARSVSVKALIEAAGKLDLVNLRSFLKVTTWCAGFPYDKEVKLARSLASHADGEVRSWAALRIAASETTASPRPRPAAKAVMPLSDTAARRIARCDETNLADAVKGCLAHPTLGLCDTLAQRPAPDHPNLAVCLALLASHDPPGRVDEQFARFSDEDPAFLDQLDQRAVKTWLHELNLPLLGHAWLFRWEQHNFVFFTALTDHWPAGLPYALRFGLAVSSPALGQRIWDALALLLGIWRWRDRTRFKESCTDALGVVLLDALTSRHGEAAARILVLLHEAAVAPELLESWKASALFVLADLDETVRRILLPWVDSRGLTGAPVPRRGSVTTPRLETLAQIRACTDPESLEAWCRESDGKVVEEAALRLLELGELGMARLAHLLRSSPPPVRATTRAITLSFWPEGPALQEMRAFVRDETASAELRFLVGLGLLEKGERDFLDPVFDAACRESLVSWFRPEDWQRLLDRGVSATELALRLAVSPHPHAYTPAVRHLATLPGFDVPVVHALEAFLQAGPRRLRDLRIEAARWLHQRGRHAAFPVLLQNEYQAQEPRTRTLLKNVPAQLIEATVTAALTAGPRVIPEMLVYDLLHRGDVDRDAQQEAYARLLMEALADSVKNAVLQKLRPSLARAGKLRRVAENFAWGMRVGRELTGRVFSVEMIGGADLGYTRFTENKLYISPLPILKGEQHGQDTVQALILHELGHHVYHRGEEQQAVWLQSQQEGLHSLLNLVADEHLERNLRALDVGFGNRLKRLAAYAFQHMEKEIPVETLLDSLQGRAFAVLTATRLGAARRPGRVAVENGRLLLEMEKAGLSFARFIRALRMGLGNRHHDPKVAAGLELFKGRFRHSSMPALYDIAKRLREIFGWETDLLNSFGQDICLNAEASDLLSHGEGISNAEVQSEIRRVLEPRKERLTDPAGGKGGPPWINVNPNEQFDPILTVVPVPHDPVQHAVYAQRVARHARQMRQYLKELGLALEPQRLRVRGKSFDRTRLQAVVTRGDPRMLIAREIEVHTDLFLGVVIDCSGSMEVRGNIEKAKLFGTMLAEAARGFRGIDLRLFGFTDSVIYDAGNAARCGVHSLKAGGGNNDAAGLWHAAQAARASQRRAKLLVMISDGLPTECSVAALRGLVSRLTQRMKICCAQVAVQALAEVCFPHYILLDDANPDVSVRRFGGVVAGLVRRALRGG